MLPQVPKIVFIKEAFVVAEVKVGELYLARIVVKAYATDAAQAIVFPTDAKAMQVGIIPAQGDLRSMMEISDGAVTAHQEQTPDQGRDLAQPHVELIDVQGHMLDVHK